MTTRFRPSSLARSPNRLVQSSIAWNGAVDIYDQEPDYNGWNAPKGFDNVRSLTEAAFALKRGLRIAEIHKAKRTEADFQFIFDVRRQGGVEDFSTSYRGVEGTIEDAVKEIVALLSEAFPKEISFRFDDVTILNNPDRRPIR